MSGSAATFASTTIDAFSAVQLWINNINANMEGGNKTGFKHTRVTVGGGTSVVNGTPGAGTLPSQYSEISMSVTATAVDFHQGQVVQTGQATHFAIKDRANIVGTNFFVVRDVADINGNVGSASLDTGREFKYYLTRDGEFHWSPAFRINNHGVDFSRTGSYVLVNNYGLLAIDRNGQPLSRSAGTFTDPPTDADKPMIVNVKKPQELLYSRYGSTIFDNNFDLINTFGGPAFNRFTTNVIDTDGNGTADATADISQDTVPGFQRADRVQSALEQATSSIVTLIPELSLAQKTFTAIAKILTVNTSYMDTTFGFIR